MQAEGAGDEFFVAGQTERHKSRFQRFLAREVAQGLMKTLGSFLNSRNGKLYLAYRPDSHFDFDSFPQFASLFADFIHESRANNSGDLPRLYMLMLNLARVMKDGIPGDLAEVGVYKGNIARLLARAARASGRRLFLFDTFSGFDPADLHGAGAGSAAFQDTSLAAVKAFVGTEAVEYVVGRFPDALSTTTLSDRYAIVHLDCDLYKPTAAALSCFYPLVSAGGLLILHDYSSGRWPGCTQAIDEFLRDKPERPVLIPDKSGTAVIVKL